MTKILELVWAFLQVGITAFGGGLSTLPLIEYQLVIKNGWMTGDGFNQLVAISQVTPGPIAINAATFAGYQQAGFWGSLAAGAAWPQPDSSPARRHRTSRSAKIFLFIWVSSRFINDAVKRRFIAPGRRRPGCRPVPCPRTGSIPRPRHRRARA